MTERFILIFAALGLIPIALAYGVAPGISVSYLFGFPIETTNHIHVFRAIKGLYLFHAAFYLAGALKPELRTPALWSLFVFMGGLASGRIVSLIVDGMPSPLLIVYLVAELALAAFALRFLLQKNRA